MTRVLFLLAGAAVACAALMLGALVLLVMLAVGTVALLARTLRGHAPAASRAPREAHVLEGHCVVLDPPAQR